MDKGPDLPSFQERVERWGIECFGIGSAGRPFVPIRFFEEALELIQAGGVSQEKAHELVDYVFSRPKGNVKDEAGNVAVMLACVCSHYGIDMEQIGEAELLRIWSPAVMAKIRARQAEKPKV